MDVGPEPYFSVSSSEFWVSKEASEKLLMTCALHSSFLKSGY